MQILSDKMKDVLKKIREQESIEKKHLVAMVIERLENSDLKLEAWFGVDGTDCVDACSMIIPSEDEQTRQLGEGSLETQSNNGFLTIRIPR
jgi:hypothetical protein